MIALVKRSCRGKECVTGDWNARNRSRDRLSNQKGTAMPGRPSDLPGNFIGAREAVEANKKSADEAQKGKTTEPYQLFTEGLQAFPTLSSAALIAFLRKLGSSKIIPVQ